MSPACCQIQDVNYPLGEGWGLLSAFLPPAFWGGSASTQNQPGCPSSPNPWPHKGADRMNAHPYRRGLEVLFKPLSFCLGGTAQAALSIPSPILHHDSICLVKKTHYHKTPLGNKPQHIHLAPSITFAVTRSVLYHYSKPQQSHFSTRN